ncbi:DMT family transporter [Pseudoblastomonas halimionae]|uniref:EamA family transporter n=1 Tax=Alteriqipengyuania halimionae TaxID=1926630 RepID=A0A6I4U827_9SPHN|nr:DMT family transporter [Alteriqipengyuania halimionae]MXP10965.1 EamA family transporter [Alteriqipengyuania halimionae]
MSAETPSLAQPRYLLPFLLVTLIWGGTWIIIKDQLSSVPSFWSICYRFMVALVGMFLLARLRGQPWRLPRGGWVIAFWMGVLQFFVNFAFVYNAERFVTSGLVAVIFALLIVPNAILGRIFLGQSITRNFVIGSLVAASGIALLFLHEYRESPAGLWDVIFGASLAIGGILGASFANILQATERGKALPLLTLLAWSMTVGMVLNAVVAFTFFGPPVWDPRPGYGLGILYLGLLGSVATFPLYYPLVRTVGAGKAAYSSVLVPVVAMVLSTLFEGFAWTVLAAGGAALAMVGMLIALQARDPGRITSPPKAP